MTPTVLLVTYGGALGRKPYHCAEPGSARPASTSTARRCRSAHAPQWMKNVADQRSRAGVVLVVRTVPRQRPPVEPAAGLLDPRPFDESAGRVEGSVRVEPVDGPDRVDDVEAAATSGYHDLAVVLDGEAEFEHLSGGNAGP